MADLSKDLKDYLSRTSSSISLGSSSSNLDGKISGSSSTSTFSDGFKSLFSRSGTTDLNSDVTNSSEGNNWFTKAQSDPLLPSLSKKQRILGFVMCLLLGSFCFSLSALYVPMLVLRARKFAMLFTLGSLFFMFSFSLLWGPVNHLRHLFSAGRLAFTSAYLFTLLGTLYFSLWFKSTVLTIIFAISQVITLIWFIVSYIPGGQTGMKFFTKLFYATASKTAQKTLPIWKKLTFWTLVIIISFLFPAYFGSYIFPCIPYWW